MYPELIKKLRVLIYNGDADSCVPYIGNEEWVDSFETQGLVKEDQQWRPWFTDEVGLLVLLLLLKHIFAPSQPFLLGLLTNRLEAHRAHRQLNWP